MMKVLRYNIFIRSIIRKIIYIFDELDDFFSQTYEKRHLKLCQHDIIHGSPNTVHLRATFFFTLDLPTFKVSTPPQTVPCIHWQRGFKIGTCCGTKEVKKKGEELTPISWSSNLIHDHMFWATSFPLARKNYTLLIQINAW